jgi:hypothetical protein
MLFRTEGEQELAISQPMHAWISGQLLRDWDEALPESLLLAAEQHDHAWTDWELNPTFDAESGRPLLFRNVGAALHAPMWAAGVDRALHNWGSHVALLLSRHGGTIYKRFTTRHQLSDADAAAARKYLETQAPKEASWARALGLTDGELARQSSLIAVVDTLSLVLCGELTAPLEIEAIDAEGKTRVLRLTPVEGSPYEFALSPWPFRRARMTLGGEARPMPKGGRFVDEQAMRDWLETAPCVHFGASLTPG